MTFISAETYGDDGLIVKTDLLVTHMGAERSYYPMPKVLVLSENVVIGVCGSDIQGGLGTVIAYWQQSDDDVALRRHLVEDGAQHRDYLMALSDRRLFVLKGGAPEWENPQGFAWIGDGKARQAVRPFDQFDWPDVEGMEGVFAETWAMVRSQDAYLHETAETVGGIPVSVYLQNGRFRFTQPIQLGQPEPRLRTFDDVLQVLMSPGGHVPHHVHHEGGYPAGLRICIGDAAAAIYEPTVDGYRGRIFVRNEAGDLAEVFVE